MNPINSFKEFFENRRIAQLRAVEEAMLEADIAEFLSEVDIRVRVFRLDESAEEIVELKASAREIMSGPMRDFSHMYLHWLNPYDNCTITERHGVIIHERWFGLVLMPWTLAEFHLGKPMLNTITRIRVDGRGTFAYDRFGNEVVIYEAGVLNPHRMADPGNRVSNACAFVQHLTGLALTMEELWPAYWAELTRSDDGTWLALISVEPVKT